MIRRIKNLWNLSNYKPKVSEEHFADGSKAIRIVEDTPDVKAEFFSDGSESDFKEFEREEKGLKGIFGIK